MVIFRPKVDPPKKGSWRSSVVKPKPKNAPGLLLTLAIFRQKQWKNSVFFSLAVSGRAIFHATCMSVVLLKRYFQAFSVLQLAGKQEKKNKLFLFVSCRWVFWHLVSFLVDVLCCLHFCNLSLQSYFGCLVFLHLGGCVSLFLSTFVFVVFYYFPHSIVCHPWIHFCLTPKQIKSQRTPIFKIMFLMLCFCLWISMLIPHNNLALSNWKQERKGMKTKQENKKQ